MNKQQLLDLAEVSDAHRLFEKVMMLGYGAFVFYVLLRVVQFYFDLPTEARTGEVSAFCGLVITAVTGFSAPLFNTYNAAKRPWPTAPPAPSLTVETKSTSIGPPQ